MIDGYELEINPMTPKVACFAKCMSSANDFEERVDGVSAFRFCAFFRSPCRMTGRTH